MEGEALGRKGDIDDEGQEEEKIENAVSSVAISVDDSQEKKEGN